MSEESVVIVDGARTPMGGLQGGLATMSAPQLGSVAIAEALSRAGVAPEDVDETFMGCVLPAGLGQSPARQALIGAGIPKSCGAVTLNKVCGSGMQAVMFANDSILVGTNRVVVAGGMESMTNAPHLIPGARGGVRSGHKTIYDHMFLDGLEDAYTGGAMGSFAQQTADDRGITREQMDAYAIESLSRARRAIEDGSLRAEMAPVTVKTRKGEVVIDNDEQPLNADPAKIPNLRPAFAEGGTVTAANSSSISDGASALVLMGAGEAEARGLSPLARIIGHSRHSQEPGLFTTAPIGAIGKLLDKTGWSVGDVDLWEINEAFAMVVMMAIEDLALDPATVNIHGGGCAMGHPIGSTGARIIVTLMYALKQRGKKRGIASLCIGGGEATAVAIEML